MLKTLFNAQLIVFQTKPIKKHVAEDITDTSTSIPADADIGHAKKKVKNKFMSISFFTYLISTLIALNLTLNKFSVEETD